MPTDERYEHVIFCDAQNTNHSALDRTLEPAQEELLAQSALTQQAAQERAQRRDAALESLKLRATEHAWPEPLTTSDLQNLLVFMGAM